MFCQSEIYQNDILKDGIDTRIAGQKTCPLEYNCPKCIHVWVTESCAGKFPLDSFFHDPERRMTLSRCIRKRCEQSNNNRLQQPLSMKDLNMLLFKK
jgi:hypothetical protein